MRLYPLCRAGGEKKLRHDPKSSQSVRPIQLKVMTVDGEHAPDVFALGYPHRAASPYPIPLAATHFEPPASPLYLQNGGTLEHAQQIAAHE